MKPARKTLLLLALLEAACTASVSMAPAPRDRQAKTFAPEAAKAHLYVFRDENIEVDSTLPVMLDGTWLGDTAIHTYLYVTLEPGKHQLVSRAWGKESAVEIDAVAGKNYFVMQEAPSVTRQRPQLTVISDEEAGRHGVNHCDMAQGNPSWAAANGAETK